MNLFEPAVLGGIHVQNHFVRSATAESKATDEGAPTDAITSLYTNLADHHVGTIITSYTYIADYEKPQAHQMGIYSDALIPAYKKVTDAVHRHGGKIVMQIVHGSSISQENPNESTILGPSEIQNPLSGITPREMTVDEIHHVIDLFADAALRVKKAGFDGVEIHAAHGYLISQFMSPIFNHRTDAYGGSRENRFRFLDEVYRAVRLRVGDDFPVWAKINSTDEMPGGLEPADFVWMASQLSREGMNAIEVSGNYWMSHTRNDRLYYIDAASDLQKHISHDVILTGGIRDASDLKKGMDAGISYFGFARPFIRNSAFLDTLRSEMEKEA